jgi:hypothetical protein
VLVDLVDAGVDRAELDHLRADRAMKRPSDGAAGGGQLGLDAAFGAMARTSASLSVPGG